MRKLIFLIPLFFAPALASAAHQSDSVRSAQELRIESMLFYRQVAYLPGNKRLKREARQFVKASDKLVKQTRRANRKPKVRRAINELSYQFRDLRKAAVNAKVTPRVRRQLRREVRGLSLALSNVEFALANGGRYALSRSKSGYATDYLASRNDTNRVKRYRD